MVNRTLGLLCFLFILDLAFSQLGKTPLMNFYNLLLCICYIALCKTVSNFVSFSASCKFVRTQNEKISRESHNQTS